VSIGWFSGANQGNPTNWNLTGSNNVWVGFEAGPNTTAQLSNSVAIGYQAANSKSNQVVLGNNATEENVLAGHLAFTHDPAGGVGLAGKGCTLAYGNDSAGKVLVSNGTAECSLYFQHTFTNPVCVLTPSRPTIAPFLISESPTTITMTIASGSESGFIN